MNEQAGQEGPTPDFIPGWFAPREGNGDEGLREAVRIPEVGDHFPVSFLRPTETVRPSRRPERGFTIGKVSEPGHELFDLAVPPGYWIIRDADDTLYISEPGHFRAQWRRLEDREWRAAADNPRIPADYKSRIDTAKVIPRPGEEAPDGWQGTPPAEGTRRALIRDTLLAPSVQLGNGAGGYLSTGSSLRLADAIESALLQSTIAAEAEPPAEGTRRRVIFEVLEKKYNDKSQWPLTPEKCVDWIEAALLEADEITDVDRLNAIAEERWKRIGELEHELGEGLGEAMTVLDRMEVPRTGGDGGNTFGIADRVTILADQLVETRRERNDAATIKFLEGEVERFLTGREEARTREGRFAEERDCGFALLRWLLPVTVAKRID